MHLVKSTKTLILLLTVALLIAATTAGVVSGQSSANGRYDTDGDGLIEINNLEQLNAIRADRDGDGRPDRDDLDGDGESDGLPGFGPATVALYEAAFPTSGAQAVCRERCYGYELARSLDFRDAGSYASGSVNAAWTSEGVGWSPIPAYNATFHGNNHTISNLYVDTPVSAGLFGYILLQGHVSGVGVVNARVAGGIGSDNAAGALVGYNFGGEISHSYSTGHVSGLSGVGGLVGFNHGGRVSHSYSSARVSGDWAVGGLVGQNDSRPIDRNTATAQEIAAAQSWVRYSHATGDVTGGDLAGGLVGKNEGSLEYVYATGMVTGDDYVGGLAGSGEVVRGYATGDVTGANFVGGLAGNGQAQLAYATGNVSGNENVGGAVGAGVPADVYATGRVTGKVNVGGLVGTLTGNLYRSYSTGRVTGDSAVGGLIGHADPSRRNIIQSYWDATTSGRTASGRRGEQDHRPAPVAHRHHGHLQRVVEPEMGLRHQPGVSGVEGGHGRRRHGLLAGVRPPGAPAVVPARPGHPGPAARREAGAEARPQWDGTTPTATV